MVSVISRVGYAKSGKNLVVTCLPVTVETINLTLWIPVYLQAHKQILGHNKQLTLLENVAENFHCFDASKFDFWRVD